MNSNINSYIINNNNNKNSGIVSKINAANATKAKANRMFKLRGSVSKGACISLMCPPLILEQAFRLVK